MALSSHRAVLEFVPDPRGDRIDLIRYEVAGMNQNPSLPSGRARLVLPATCFGEGADSVSFNAAIEASRFMARMCQLGAS